MLNLPWNSSRYPFLGGFLPFWGTSLFMRAVSLQNFQHFFRDASGVWVVFPTIPHLQGWFVGQPGATRQVSLEPAGAAVGDVTGPPIVVGHPRPPIPHFPNPNSNLKVSLEVWEWYGSRLCEGGWSVEKSRKMKVYPPRLKGGLLVKFSGGETSC